MHPSLRKAFMNKNVKVNDSIVTVKTVVVDSKKITKSTLNVLPFLPARWFELLDNGSLLILSKLAKDVTQQLIRKRGYSNFNGVSFEYGLIIHFDEQLFISVMPQIDENPNFSELLNDLYIKARYIKNEQSAIRWSDEELLSQAEYNELDSELDSLIAKIDIQKEKIRIKTDEIDRTVKYALI